MFFWEQTAISSYMDELFKEGYYNFNDNGTYREYFDSKKLNDLNQAVLEFKKSVDEYFENYHQALWEYRFIDFIKTNNKYRYINGDRIFSKFKINYQDDYIFFDYEKFSSYRSLAKNFKCIVEPMIIKNGDVFIDDAIDEFKKQYPSCAGYSKSIYDKFLEIYHDEFKVSKTIIGQEYITKNFSYDIEDGVVKFEKSVEDYFNKHKCSFSEYSAVEYIRKDDFVKDNPEYKDSIDEIYKVFKNKYAHKYEFHFDEFMMKSTSEAQKLPTEIVEVLSEPNPKKKDNRISRSKALNFIKNNKGKIFSCIFVKKDGSERKITGTYIKSNDENLGLIKVKEFSKTKTHPDDCIRYVNVQTLKRLKINGENYRVKS